jgi:predicted Zn-dependent protease
MMRFAGSDDELAVVVSHELAHNAMRHMDAKKKNATLGAILGATLDVAAASQGVNTGGGFSQQGAQAGARSYSQDFEREADYVGMYILARAGRPYADAPNFWRRMGQESPGSIRYASTHPTSAERFIRLDKTVAELKAKLASGAPLLPEAKAPGAQAPDSAGVSKP